MKGPFDSTNPTHTAEINRLMNKKQLKQMFSKEEEQFMASFIQYTAAEEARKQLEADKELEEEENESEQTVEEENEEYAKFLASMSTEERAAWEKVQEMKDKGIFVPKYTKAAPSDSMEKKEEVKEGKTETKVESKKETAITGIKTQGALTVAQSAALVVIRNLGAKNGDELAKRFAEHFGTQPDTEDLMLLYNCCKKFPLKESEFEEVSSDSLAKSEKNMKALGMTAEQIAKSGPRVTYLKNKKALKKYLEKNFWEKKVDEKVMNWGNFVRVPYVEEFCAALRAANQGLKPKAPSLIYTNTYWMTADFDSAYREATMRIYMIATLMEKCKKGIKHDNSVRGRFTISAALAKIFEGSTREEFGTFALPDTRPELDELLKLGSNRDLLDCVVMVDPRKLLQTRTIRQGRPRRNGAPMTKEHATKLNMIIALMQAVIVIADMSYDKVKERVQERVKDGMKITLTNGSDFMKLYYASYGEVHNFTRQMKRLVFGNPSGRETRAMDMENFGDIGGKGDVHGDSWDNVQKTFNLF